MCWDVMDRGRVCRVQVMHMETMWIFFETKHALILSYSFLPNTYIWICQWASYYLFLCRV